MKRRLILLLPLMLFILLLSFLLRGLSINPHQLPSVLLNKPVPQFKLPRLYHPHQFVTDAELQCKLSLVNVWASWCAACLQDQPELLSIASTARINLIGIDYKDKQANAKAWLTHYGNPFTKIGFDKTGRVAIDWGVYGTPETFLVDKQGRIRYKFIGPITEKVWQRQFKPRIAALQEQRCHD